MISLLAIILIIGIFAMFYVLHREMDREHKLRIGKLEARHERERQAFSSYRQNWQNYMAGDVSFDDAMSAYRNYCSVEQGDDENGY